VFLCILHANVTIKSVENSERRNFPFPAIGKSDQQWSKILLISDSEEVCKDMVFSCEALKRLCKHASVHQRCKKTCNKCQGDAFWFDIFPGGATYLRHNYEVGVTSDKIASAKVPVFHQDVHETRILWCLHSLSNAKARQA